MAILKETPLAADQAINSETDKNTYVLEATTLDSWQLRWWILSQGANIEIINPVELRERTRDTLAQAYKGYRD